MRYLLIISLLLSGVFSFSQQKNSFVKKLPDRNKTVNDFGRFLTSRERDTLEKELKDYLKQTSNAIVVVTLESLTDPKTEKAYTIEEAALAYFNTWGVGDKVKNNGVLLMVSRNPRKVRIQVGTGLETILTNESCQQIVDNYLVPNFKDGFFFAGIKEAVAAIEKRLDNPVPVVQEQAAKPFVISTNNSSSSYSPYEEKDPVIGFAIIGGIIVICVLVYKFSSAQSLREGWLFNRGGYRRHRRRSFWSSGGSSGGGSYGGGSYGGGSSSGGGASGSW